MNVRELMEMLEEYLDDDYADGTAPGPEVRFASQPSWPFEYDIDTVALADPSDPDEDGETADGDPVVYLAEGSQLRYLPAYAARAVGW